MIAPYAVERLESFRREIDECLRDLQYTHRYPAPFEGDDVEKLNAIALEYKVRKSMQNLLRKSTELAVYEAIISDKMYKQLEKALWKLWERQQKLKREYAEEIDIIEGYIPGTVFKKEKRSYKGLAPESMIAEHPRLNTLRTEVWEWLKKQEFRVFRKNSSLFARKGPKNARKGCYVAVVKDYEKEEVETFTEPFWQYVNKVVIELVGKKKFKVET
jgi:hypothetical protein